jgi:hypothetical protein
MLMLSFIEKCGFSLDTNGSIDITLLDIIFFNCKICWKHSHLLRHKDDISDPFKIFPVKEQVYFTDQHKEITFVSNKTILCLVDGAVSPCIFIIDMSMIIQ